MVLTGWPGALSMTCEPASYGQDPGQFLSDVSIRCAKGGPAVDIRGGIHERAPAVADARVMSAVTSSCARPQNCRRAERIATNSDRYPDALDMDIDQRGSGRPSREDQRPGSPIVRGVGADRRLHTGSRLRHHRDRNPHRRRTVGSHRMEDNGCGATHLQEAHDDDTR